MEIWSITGFCMPPDTKIMKSEPRNWIHLVLTPYIINICLVDNLCPLSISFILIFGLLGVFWGQLD